MTLFVFYLFQESSGQHEDIGEETQILDYYF